MNLLQLGLLLAQKNQSGSLLQLLFPMVAIGILFYFIMIRPDQKKRQEMQEQVEKLKKNDRVVTIGGILGTVVNVQKDEVVLRIDENTNARIHMKKSSILSVVKDGEPKEEEKA